MVLHGDPLLPNELSLWCLRTGRCHRTRRRRRAPSWPSSCPSAWRWAPESRLLSGPWSKMSSRPFSRCRSDLGAVKHSSLPSAGEDGQRTRGPRSSPVSSRDSSHPAINYRRWNLLLNILVFFQTRCHRSKQVCLSRLQPDKQTQTKRVETSDVDDGRDCTQISQNITNHKPSRVHEDGPSTSYPRASFITDCRGSWTRLHKPGHLNPSVCKLILGVTKHVYNDFALDCCSLLTLIKPNKCMKTTWWNEDLLKGGHDPSNC